MARIHAQAAEQSLPLISRIQVEKLFHTYTYDLVVTQPLGRKRVA